MYLGVPEIDQGGGRCHSMRIRQLEIEGFRSLKRVTWIPGDLNVVIGPNGTGKSNLLRFLELMSISARGGLSRHIQSLGGMEPIVWDGMASSIVFKLKTRPPGGRPDLALAYELELARLGQSSSYRIPRELLCSCCASDGGTHSESSTLVRRERGAPFVRHDGSRVQPITEDSFSEEEAILPIVAGPFAVSQRIALFQEQLTSWAVYHDVPVHQAAALRQSAVASLVKRVDPDGQNLIPTLHTLYTGDRDFKREVNEAMRAAFSDDFEELVFPPAADQRIQLRVRWKSLKREQSAADLSDGTLRFLFLLTVLACPSPPPVIAIDEPETGLHPSMLPIIAEYAVEAAMRSQVILTTHSPQFLDAFTETRPTTTVVKWEDGESKLTVLGAEELNYWLQEYSLGNLFKSGELESM